MVAGRIHGRLKSDGVYKRSGGVNLGMSVTIRVLSLSDILPFRGVAQNWSGHVVTTGGSLMSPRRI